MSGVKGKTQKQSHQRLLGMLGCAGALAVQTRPVPEVAEFCA